MSNAYDLLFPYDEEHIAVRQATKQGFILCEWGGCRSLIPYEQTEARQGTGKRTDLSHSYGGNTQYLQDRKGQRRCMFSRRY